MNLKFKTIIFLSLLFVVLFFLSSCSGCDNPLRCSIQDKLDKVEILPVLDNGEAVIKVQYFESKSNVCVCSAGLVKENNCNSGYEATCDEDPNTHEDICFCKEKDSPDCVDNNEADDKCSYGACGYDPFKGVNIKCKTCTDNCGKKYDAGCEECSSPGTCSCSYSEEEGSWYVSSNNCNSGYSASCKSNGNCVCASEEE